MIFYKSKRNSKQFYVFFCLFVCFFGKNNNRGAWVVVSLIQLLGIILQKEQVLHLNLGKDSV